MPIIQRINIVHARRKSVEENKIGDIILHEKILAARKKRTSTAHKARTDEVSAPKRS